MKKLMIIALFVFALNGAWGQKIAVLDFNKQVITIKITRK